MPKPDQGEAPSPEAPLPQLGGRRRSRTERLEELEQKLRRLNRETLMELEAMIEEKRPKKS